jgi:hypothetical protein
MRKRFGRVAGLMSKRPVVLKQPDRLGSESE